MVMVDSSIWIELFRKDGDLLTSLAVEDLLEEMQATFCGVIKVEVLGGARPNERVTISNLFSLVPYLPMPEPGWDDVVKFQWIAKKAGLTIPWSDAVIATLAQKNGCRVYARDRHFDALGEHGLIELYSPGPGGSFTA